MKRKGLFTLFVMLVALGVAACGATPTPAPTPGINGKWLSRMGSASLEITLQSEASCQAAQPCTLTGTWKDNRQGLHGAFDRSTLTGTAVHLTGVSGMDKDVPFTIDGTLSPDGLKLSGTWSAKAVQMANPEIFQLAFVKQ